MIRTIAEVIAYALWVVVFMIAWMFVLAIPEPIGTPILIACVCAAIAYALAPQALTAVRSS